MEHKIVRHKAYIYTRVSTAMQVDGFSLDAQREDIQAYAKISNIEIVGEYCDEGKSGKTTQSRTEFNRMIRDIKAKKDDVRYVIVFKLSRFARNAADTLSNLLTMQNYDFCYVIVCGDGVREHPCPNNGRAKAESQRG